MCVRVIQATVIAGTGAWAEAWTKAVIVLGAGRAFATLDRMGLGYNAVAAVHPTVIYTSVSGFGNSGSPYADWPAYASIVEAMSGIYEYRSGPDRPPVTIPVGALGDISSAMFGSAEKSSCSA